MAGIVHAQSHRRHDARTIFANALGEGDEGLHAAAPGSRAEPVEQGNDLVFAEVAREYRSQGFFQGVDAPQVAPTIQPPFQSALRPADTRLTAS